jgi:hypothetical protein
VNSKKEENRWEEMKIMKNKIKIWNFLAKKETQVKCIPKDLEIKVSLKKDKEKYDH